MDIHLEVMPNKSFVNMVEAEGVQASEAVHAEVAQAVPTAMIFGASGTIFSGGPGHVGSQMR